MRRSIALLIPLGLLACGGAGTSTDRRTLIDSRDNYDPRSLDPALSTRDMIAATRAIIRRRIAQVYVDKLSAPVNEIILRDKEVENFERPSNEPILRAIESSASCVASSASSGLPRMRRHTPCTSAV